MFTYYQVKKWKFSHYGEALHYARQIGALVQIKKSWNPLRGLATLINNIT